MKQDMSRRMRISSRLMYTGFFLFTIYGVLAAIFREQIAAYQYNAFSSADLRTLAEVTQYFAFDQVLLVGLMGAGLAICAGALVRLGLNRRLGLAFIAGIAGGAVGLIPLMIIHIHQSAWFMVIADNACLIWITVGSTVGMKEIILLFRRKGVDA